MATGPGPKRQEGGTVPGCEVAGWGLTQALVGYLHCEETQSTGLIWNLPKPGGQAKGFQLPSALRFVPCTPVTTGTTSNKAPAIPFPS